MLFDTIKISLFPLGLTFEAEKGTPLQDLLFEHGVEFPCGGQGLCKGCRIKLLHGNLPPTPQLESLFTEEEIRQGWRLACLYTADSDLTLELAQWEAPILTDFSKIEFTPSEGIGIAIDLGTTTIAAQLIDCRTGYVLGVESALNPQAQFGADIMSRIQFDIQPANRNVLTDIIRNELSRLVESLIKKNQTGLPLQQITLCGNTVMHHLFCGIDTTPLAFYPFEPAEPGIKTFPASEIGWTIENNPAITFLPNLGSFVGSDLLAGILATGMHESNPLIALIDLGTNGEILIGNKEKILCASTAAGPAFEGGRISMGMRAATGAISSAAIQQNEIRCHVIGHVKPRGICGSGLVDAAACSLNLNLIQPTGRLSNGSKEIVLEPPIVLIQKDIRELQLAKAAIAAGTQILLSEINASWDDIQTFYLAGAFGNYLNPHNAKRIGLFSFPEEKITPAGNTALQGAKICLLNGLNEDAHFRSILATIQHIPISSSPKFQEIYVDEMNFPV